MSGEITRNILEHLTTAVMCLDEDLMLTYLNPACEMLFGVSSRHIENLPLVQALPQFTEQQNRLQDAQQEGLAYTEREVCLNLADGAQRTVDCSVTPYINHEGKRGLLLELLNLDRHLRISRDDQLLTQHAVSRQVVRGLAHEIKNPLGGLRGAAQLLEGELADPELTEYTGIIIREADRLQDMVDRLLGPNQPPQKKLINIHAPLEHVRQLVRAEPNSGVEITQDYDPSLPELLADEDQLTQVFLNIIRNAVQAMGDTPGKIDPAQLEELARRLSGLLPPGLAGLRGELEQNFRAVLAGGLEKLDLISREEFEVQKAVLAKTRSRLEELERQLAEMEKTLSED